MHPRVTMRTLARAAALLAVPVLAAAPAAGQAPTPARGTVVQIWVPQGSPAVGKEYDPATHIAVPGNTARQRLIQSGRPYQDH